MSNFAERLRSARKKKGLSQQYLADLIGVSRVQITQCEGGNVERPKYIAEIAKVLGVSACWLMFGEDENLTSEAQRVARDWDSLSQRDQMVVSSLIESLKRKYPNSSVR